MKSSAIPPSGDIMREKGSKSEMQEHGIPKRTRILIATEIHGEIIETELLNSNNYLSPNPYAACIH
jgi:hypothetical protein